MFSILVASGLANGLIYALMALGIVILVKGTDGINGAHGDSATLAAYVTFSVLAPLALGPGYALLGVVTVAVVFGTLAFLILGRLFRPNHATSLLIATIGLSFLVRGFIRVGWGGQGDYISVPPLTTSPPVFIGDDIIVPAAQIIVALGALAILATLILFFRFTRLGLFMRAVADNPRAALIVGIPMQFVLGAGFVLSVLVASLSGYLIAPTILIYPDLGFPLFLKGFAAAILGGLYSLPGAILGGLLVGLTESLAAGYVSTRIQDVAAFVIIFVTLAIIPDGLLGVRRRRAV